MDPSLYYRLDQKHPAALDPMSPLYGTTHTFHSVAQTTFTAPDIKISTVFLALDPSLSIEGRPLLFETMVFGGHFNNYCVRYSTWDEAVRGHMKTLEMIQSEL